MLCVCIFIYIYTHCVKRIFLNRPPVAEGQHLEDLSTLDDSMTTFHPPTNTFETGFESAKFLVSKHILNMFLMQNVMSYVHGSY